MFAFILSCDLISSMFSVCRSRQNVIKDHTIEWLDKHYPEMFDEIHFGNHFSLEGISKPKSEICRYASISAYLRTPDSNACQPLLLEMIFG